MEIIVDSGSSKADWLITQQFSAVSKVRTMGFNPFFHSADFITQEIHKTFSNLLNPDEIITLIYYGAGCSSVARNQVIIDGISGFFKNAKVEVFHDILAAARATCFNKPGIACILGTGSNSCLYNGTEIIDNLPSLGFMLGDEGSGSHFGKSLIRKLFYRELPDDLLQKFKVKYNYSKENILDKLYNQPNVNVFLAKFAEFFSENSEHPAIKDMVRNCFNDFFRCHVVKYKNYKEVEIHFVGSIGFLFRDILEEVSADFNVKLGLTIRTPIENLLEYHSRQFVVK